jgi:hypothetical protein
MLSIPRIRNGKMSIEEIYQVLQKREKKKRRMRQYWKQAVNKSISTMRSSILLLQLSKDKFNNKTIQR